MLELYVNKNSVNPINSKLILEVSSSVLSDEP